MTELADKEGPTPTASELTTIEEHQQRIQNFVRTEGNLDTIGYYDAGYRRRIPAAGTATKTIRLSDGRRIRIVPTAEYGFPNTEDLDFDRGFARIVAKQLQRRASNQPGRQNRPTLKFDGPSGAIGFSTGELLRESGKDDGGKERKAAHEWVRRRIGTMIEGRIRTGADGDYQEIATSVFHEAYFVGDKMRHGQTADKIYVWPAKWYLSNLAHNLTYIIDTDLHRALSPYPIGKHLYPMFLSIFLGANGVKASKRYSAICELLTIPVYKHASRREQQLNPSLNRLRQEGFFSRYGWDHQGQDAVIYAYAGPRMEAHVTERDARRQLRDEIDNSRQTVLAFEPEQERDRHEARMAVIDYLTDDLAQLAGSEGTDFRHWFRSRVRVLVDHHRRPMLEKIMAEIRAGEAKNPIAYAIDQLKALVDHNPELARHLPRGAASESTPQ